jgi:hypothetical protein
MVIDGMLRVEERKLLEDRYAMDEFSGKMAPVRLRSTSYNLETIIREKPDSLLILTSYLCYKKPTFVLSTFGFLIITEKSDRWCSGSLTVQEYMKTVTNKGSFFLLADTK